MLEMFCSLPKQRQGQRIPSDIYVPHGLRKTREHVYVALSNNLLPNNISIFPARFTRIILVKKLISLCFVLAWNYINLTVLYYDDKIH